MQTLVLLALASTALVIVAGGVIAFFALRHAPEGVEDEAGFRITGAVETHSPRTASATIAVES